MRIIYAYNDVPPDPTSKTLPYHTKRGVKSLYLVEPKAEKLQTDDGIKTWEILSPEVGLYFY